jgi:hypothetical protein
LTALAATATTEVSAAPPHAPGSASAAKPKPLKLDHFLCYFVMQLPAKLAHPFKIPNDVELDNQFTPKPIMLSPKSKIAVHCNPALKVVTPKGGKPRRFPPKSPSWHLLCVSMKAPKQPAFVVRVTNQFGTAQLKGQQPNYFCLPSLKSLTGPTFKKPGKNEVEPDHFTCYPVSYNSTQDHFQIPPLVQVGDQFSNFGLIKVDVGAPAELCVPTQKTVGPAETPIRQPLAHLLCFKVSQTKGRSPFWDQNQFGVAKLKTIATATLCLPSYKTIVSTTAVPAQSDITGVGAGSDQYLFDQFSDDYNSVIPGTAPHLYSFDATGGPIVTKTTCASIPRPATSSDGIMALSGNVKTANTTDFCIDFARSERGRMSFDPASVAFVSLAKEGVTWATQAVTDAPANLTISQLDSIYTCKVTNWNQVSGKNGPIKPFLPPLGSDTRTNFLKAISLLTPGPCVTTLATSDDGDDPMLASPEAIVAYSISSYIAEKYHSAACTPPTCLPIPACTSTGTDNLFGCDDHGTMVLGDVDGTAPLTGPAADPLLNLNFAPSFLSVIYDVVRFAGTGDHIPAYLEPLFSSTTGWVCTDPTAQADITDYGFRLFQCGASS